jgi:site-specific DNA-methyltransferase (adenine-specific)
MIDRITEQPFCQTRVSGSTFVNADCFDVFPFIEDKSIDAIICDLPYGTTNCKWDSVLPLNDLWNEYKRVIKDNGVIVLTSTQPFTSVLIGSNLKEFKYEWIWQKSHATGHLNSKKQPMRQHENICVFYKKQCTYNPQMIKKSYLDKRTKSGQIENVDVYNSFTKVDRQIDVTDGYPKTIQYFATPFKGGEGGKHPTQKPLSLMEYLINTYTNEGDTVLDNTMGSGTTNLACIKLNRKSIGIEKEKQYYDVAVRRASEYCH